VKPKPITTTAIDHSAVASAAVDNRDRRIACHRIRSTD
jgi:hypothetical protein